MQKVHSRPTRQLVLTIPTDSYPLDWLGLAWPATSRTFADSPTKALVVNEVTDEKS